MPKIPIDYNKAVIYKIVCNDIKIKECYYGSTTNFVKRKNSHKSICNNKNNKEYNQSKYQFIRENGGWGNWKMVLVKEFPCKNKLELEREERKCMEEDEFRLNVNNPYITEEERKEYGKEYRDENKEIINKQKKEYHQKNRAVILAKNNVKTECCCGGHYTTTHKQRHLKTDKHQNYIKEQDNN